MKDRAKTECPKNCSICPRRLLGFIIRQLKKVGNATIGVLLMILLPLLDGITGIAKASKRIPRNERTELTVRLLFLAIISLTVIVDEGPKIYEHFHRLFV
jgi:hypothetical protein